MSIYFQQHPLIKCGALTPSSLATFLRENAKSLQAKFQAWKQRAGQPGYIPSKLKEYSPALISGAVGLGTGAYLGNEAYHNALPPVRTLPRYLPPLNMNTDGN